MRPRVTRTRFRVGAQGGPSASTPRRVDQLRELVRLAEQAQCAGRGEVAASLISRAYLLHDGRLRQATH